MSRRRSAVIRKVLPDPIFGDEVVSKFINVMMIDGKRPSAEKIFYGALDIIKAKHLKNIADCEKSLDVFKLALENVKPLIEVRSRRVGGANYQVPVEVRPKRRQALAFRWLIEYSRKRSGKSIQESLAAEIADAAFKRGGSIKKKEDIHKMADANKAFAHYRW